MPTISKVRGKNESESITLRVDKSILNELRQESVQKVEKINTLANRIFKSYVNWHKPANSAGLVYISKAFLVEALGSLADEQIVKLAKNYVKSQIKDKIHMLRRDYTVLSFLDVLCSWLELGDFHYRHDESNNYNTYVIQLDMGRKWSIFFGKYLQYAFEDLKVKNVEFEVTDNMVMFRIKK